MSQQNPQYGQDPYNQQSPPAESQEGYDAASQPGGPPPTGPAATHGGRKKRAYAGHAYEFGAGANADLGGQQQAGGAYSGFSTQQEAAGYPQGGYQQNPTAVQQGSTPLYPGQDPAAAGYQPPGQGYPAPAVGGVTQQFGQMDLSQKPVPAPAPAQAQQRPPALNQLYPTDLSNQPLNVAELDYPPPPAILPANVSILSYPPS